MNQVNPAIQREDLEDEEQSLDAGKQWLISRLADRLTESAVRTREGEYTRARGPLDDRYQDNVRQYGDVADTPEEQAIEQRLVMIRSSQLAFIDTVEDYHETHQEYQQAQQAGQSDQARRLAHELERDANRAHEQRGQVVRLAGELSANTSTDFSSMASAVNATTDEINATQESIREAEFTPTSLVVSRPRTNATFSEPGVVSGRLTTEEGEPLGDQTIELRVNDRRVRTRTDQSGRFSIRYRPTTDPVGSTNASVHYLPANDSVYLGSSASVPLTVQQVRPNVTVNSTADVVRYGDRVVVTGSVGLGDVQAAGVPVQVRLGETTLGFEETGEDGRYRVVAQVPASVPNGTLPIQTSVALEGRALSGESGQERVVVQSTSTSLTLREVSETDEGVYVRGRLTTESGLPLGGQTVIIRADETAIATVQTGADGTFETTESLPARFRPPPGMDSTLHIQVRFRESESNLAPASANTGVQLSTSLIDIQAIADFLGASLVRNRWWLLGIVGGIVAGTAGLIWWRRDQTSARTDEGQGHPRATDVDGYRVPGSDTDGQKVIALSDNDDQLLDIARAQRADGHPEVATELAYLAAYARLGERYGVEPKQTHWEFYTDCVDQISNDVTGELFRRLTEAYELAAFSGRAIPTESVTDAIEAADTLVNGTKDSYGSD